MFWVEQRSEHGGRATLALAAPYHKGHHHLTPSDSPEAFNIFFFFLRVFLRLDGCSGGITDDRLLRHLNHRYGLMA